MNVLVLGSGGREHTLAWKINQSPECEKLFVLPGNAGTSEFAENIDLPVSDFKQIGRAVLEKSIDLVVVGPEAPLVDGIRNYFEADPSLADIKFIGPGKEGAMLEGSKDFAKKFMSKYNIPTARSSTYTDKEIERALGHIRSLVPPIVVKADGLAAGKGVIICESKNEAEQVINQMLIDKKFGEASSKVVVEEYLEGIEVSVFLLTDGNNYVVFPEAKDYKRIGENDTGPNTGGMGSVSPVNFADRSFMDKIEKRIIQPTIKGLQQENIDFIGFIFLGLMNINGDPFVIEYNVRMGDPESQVVIPRIKDDFLGLLEAAADRKLDDKPVYVDEDTAVTVVAASGGYPGSYEKGKEIEGLDKIDKALVFHAGTKKTGDGKIVTSGGRVLAVTGKGNDIQEAVKICYEEMAKIEWEGMQFRRDIGNDLLSLEK